MTARTPAAGTGSAPIRTAVIGFGVSGRVFHAPFLEADPDYRLDLIVTANPERRAEAESRHPSARVVSDVDAVWAAAAELDLVVIGSPSGTHASLAERALDAGLDVVVDKPFAVTADEGRALITQAERLGRTLTVFQNRRWDGDFQTLRALVDSGELGEVRRFESRFEWWKPEPPTSWKTEAGVTDGGGILYDLGTHLIDQAVQLFGPVDDVSAEVHRRREATAADDDVFVALRHASGTMSHLWMSAVAPLTGPRFHMLGSRAGYTTWGLDPQEPALIAGALPGDPGFGAVPEERWGTLGAGDETRTHPTLPGDYGAFYRALAPALRGHGPLPVDPNDAVAVLEIIERVHAAASVSA
ncbi:MULTISPECIES: Gfo/Idh/MocA family oxidoreductase [Microbacterium]|uniref:Gfo/Idh/MocA family protein n=1 Tax=Microbacterium TaxID=33882 RepID=UPI00277E4F55|nr:MULTISPECIES: Gfo/Idh/MocA family oxidoreductase [Microbacterium]MDQ1082238.1 putative dehydrogenase [Microbacterium sp. SORGH_AS_0344]MDQ1168991.1 putative dehydrogenase [Microbacterium proteolyticum]